MVGARAPIGLCEFGKGASLTRDWDLPQGGRRALAENAPIRRGETAELGKSIASSRFHDVHCGGLSMFKRDVHQVQSPKPNILAGAHAQDAKAAHSQGAFRHPNDLTKLRYRQLPVEPRRQCFLEPAHSDRATAPTYRVLLHSISWQATDEGVDQVVFDSSADFALCEESRIGFGKVACF